MSDIEQFLAAANKVFNLGEEGRGKQNKYYIHLPATLSEARLPTSGNSPENSSRLTNPFIFLTDIWATVPYNLQTVADSPSVSLIVGQYGLGKTELVYQVCQYIVDNASPGASLKPLPVNLALCREDIGRLADEMTVEDFAQLLFSRVLKEARLDLSFVQTQLLREIQMGKILLILDGFDELISTSAQHYQFLSNLPRFLTAGERGSHTNSAFRVVVSVRLEYLSGVASDDASDLAGIINANLPTEVDRAKIYFLKLDLLENDRVTAYFKKRLKGGGAVVERVSSNSRLLDMLRRPLLLRIFCDLAEKYGRRKLTQLLGSFKDNEHPAFLVQEFVTWAARDAHLDTDRKRLTALVWDAELLAHKSLELYETGKSEMNLDDVKSVLKVELPSYQEENILETPLKPVEILQGIHKCPFLWKDARARIDAHVLVRFAHRIFFEYFVVKGIVLQKELDNYNPWMNLVLNVDMRKFLKGLIKDDEWYERTKKSYALERKDLETWDFKNEIDFNEIEEERKLFLDYMTDPEHEEYIKDSEGKLAKAINRFLDKEMFLHPRYLLYQFEAVAIYVWYHRWTEQGANISRRFSEVLKRRLAEIPQTLLRKRSSVERPEELPVQDPLELLLERILHIGQRLRYTWAKEIEGKRGELLDLIKDPNTRNRIDAVFNSIEKALF